MPKLSPTHKPNPQFWCCYSLTVHLDDHILQRLVHAKVEAHIGHHADDRGQPAAPERQQALLPATQDEQNTHSLQEVINARAGMEIRWLRQSASRPSFLQASTRVRLASAIAGCAAQAGHRIVGSLHQRSGPVCSCAQHKLTVRCSRWRAAGRGTAGARFPGS